MDRGWSDDLMESQVLTPPQVEGRWVLSVKRDKFRNVFFFNFQDVEMLEFMKHSSNSFTCRLVTT